MLVILFASLIIDVGKCVELIGYDIDVVASDTMTLGCYALALIHTGDGMKLTAAHLVLDAVEVVGNGVYSGRVTYQNHFVCQELWLQMQMETRAVGIDNQF